MSLRYYANAPATTLAASVTSGATSFVVVSTAGLPVSFPFTLIIDRGTATEEAVEVSAVAGTVLTVSRGVDATTAFAHASGATVAHGITARDIREANSHIEATVAHGATGAVVGTTNAQTLTNKTLTSPSLTGNPTAPTASVGDNDTSIATTAFVQTALTANDATTSVPRGANVNSAGLGPQVYRRGQMATLTIEITTAALIPAANALLTIPVGYRPVTRIYFTVGSRLLFISTDGTVKNVVDTASGVAVDGSVTYPL